MESQYISRKASPVVYLLIRWKYFLGIITPIDVNYVSLSMGKPRLCPGWLKCNRLVGAKNNAHCFVTSVQMPCCLSRGTTTHSVLKSRDRLHTYCHHDLRKSDRYMTHLFPHQCPSPRVFLLGLDYFLTGCLLHFPIPYEKL